MRERVTLDSVRNHCARHFPVQQAARELKGTGNAPLLSGTEQS